MRSLLLATAMLAGLAAAPASAATYAFSFTALDASASGSGFFTTAAAAPSLVTAISGTLSSASVGPGTFTITGLSSYAGADNQLLAAAPYVTFGGISFTTDIGGTFNFGLGGSNLPYGTILNSSVLNPSGNFVGSPGSLPIDLTVSQVPEPASWALMVLGFGLAGVALRRRAEPALA